MGTTVQFCAILLFLTVVQYSVSQNDRNVATNATRTEGDDREHMDMDEYSVMFQVLHYMDKVSGTCMTRSWLFIILTKYALGKNYGHLHPQICNSGVASTDRLMSAHNRCVIERLCSISVFEHCRFMCLLCDCVRSLPCSLTSVKNCNRAVVLWLLSSWVLVQWTKVWFYIFGISCVQVAN